MIWQADRWPVALPCAWQQLVAFLVAASLQLFLIQYVYLPSWALGAVEGINTESFQTV